MFKKNLMILLGFTNYRLLNKSLLGDLLSIKENSLEDTDSFDKSNISKIEDFLLLGDEDKIFLNSWLAIKKKVATQEKT